MGVLIVDDATFMRVMIRGILERHGIEVVGEASNGVEAIEKCKQLKPNIITMDITLPEMNGIEATREIMKFNPSINVLMCSAMGQQGLIIDAINAGAKGFIVKPFQEERVIKEIKQFI